MVTKLALACGALLALSGCIAAAPALFVAGSAGTAGVVGAGMYNATQEDDSKSGLAQAPQAPVSVMYRAQERDAASAVVNALVESGDSVAASTDRFIKTEKRRINEAVTAVTAVMGNAEVYVVKTITLSPENGGTRVSVKVDLYRKTLWTQERKADWPEQEAAIRGQFFEALSAKLRPAA